MTKTRGPDTRPLEDTPEVSRARPAAPDTREAPDEGPAPAPPSAPAPVRRGPRLTSGRLLAGGLALLAAAIAGIYLEAVVTAVTAARPGPHWLGLAGLALATAGAVGLTVRELRALRRLARIDALQARARAVYSGEAADDPALVREIATLIRPRAPEAVSAYDREAAGVGDAVNQLAAFDTRVLAELDTRADAAITAAIRRNATATALSPFAVLDASVTLWVNVRLVRRLAEIYGGRPGTVAAVRLTRHAFATVLAAGVFETAQDALNDIVGGGVAGRVSTAMASAVTNGLLTARLGLAAADACRPVPRTGGARTSARGLLRQALSAGLTGRRPNGA